MTDHFVNCDSQFKRWKKIILKVNSLYPTYLYLNYWLKIMVYNKFIIFYNNLIKIYII